MIFLDKTKIELHKNLIRIKENEVLSHRTSVKNLEIYHRTWTR